MQRTSIWEHKSMRYNTHFVDHFENNRSYNNLNCVLSSSLHSSSARALSKREANVFWSRRLRSIAFCKNVYCHQCTHSAIRMKYYMRRLLLLRRVDDMRLQINLCSDGRGRYSRLGCHCRMIKVVTNSTATKVCTSTVVSIVVAFAECMIWITMLEFANTHTQIHDKAKMVLHFFCVFPFIFDVFVFYSCNCRRWIFPCLQNALVH